MTACALPPSRAAPAGRAAPAPLRAAMRARRLAVPPSPPPMLRPHATDGLGSAAYARASGLSPSDGDTQRAPCERADMLTVALRVMAPATPLGLPPPSTMSTTPTRSRASSATACRGRARTAQCCSCSPAASPGTDNGHSTRTQARATRPLHAADAQTLGRGRLLTGLFDAGSESGASGRVIRVETRRGLAATLPDNSPHPGQAWARASRWRCGKAHYRRRRRTAGLGNECRARASLPLRAVRPARRAADGPAAHPEGPVRAAGAVPSGAAPARDARADRCAGTRRRPRPAHPEGFPPVRSTARRGDDEGRRQDADLADPDGRELAYADLGMREVLRDLLTNEQRRRL